MVIVITEISYIHGFSILKLQVAVRRRDNLTLVIVYLDDHSIFDLYFFDV